MSGPQQVTVGIVGGGLMGKEVAAALARWPGAVLCSADVWLLLAQA